MLKCPGTDLRASLSPLVALLVSKVAPSQGSHVQPRWAGLAAAPRSVPGGRSPRDAPGSDFCPARENKRVCSPTAPVVKNPPAMQETWVQSLGQEDPLEEGMTTHSSILAWRIPWTEEPGGLQSMGSQKHQTRLK